MLGFVLRYSDELVCTGIKHRDGTTGIVYMRLFLHDHCVEGVEVINTGRITADDDAGDRGLDKDERLTSRRREERIK